MASGTLSLGKSKQTEGQLLWTATSNGTSANTSTVTVTLQVRRWDGNYTTTGTWKGSVSIGGISENYSFYSAVNSWTTVKTLTVTVNHNNDGSGTCYIYGSISGPAQTTQAGATVSGSTTITLDTIARQATMKTVQPFNDGSISPKITYSNPLGAAVPSLQAGVSLTQSSSGVLTYYNVDKTAGTATLSLSESDLNALRSSVTTEKSRTVWIYLRTRIDSTYYYSPLSTTFTVESAKPTISPTITDTNSVTIDLTGDSKKLVRYYSNVAVTIGASALNGASITSRAVTCGGKKLTADGTISGVEIDKFTFTATDSRGLVTTQSITSADGLYSFINYVKLTCNLANDVPSTDGTMVVRTTGNYFNGSFGAKSNSLNVYYRYKVAGTSWPTDGGWNIMTVSKNGNTYTATATVDGLDYQTAYVFQTYAKDTLATIYSVEKTAKATPVFDWGEHDFNFNVPVSVGRTTLSDNAIGVGGTTLCTNLTGVCNVGDYVYTVYPLCKLSTTDSGTYNSSTQGIFYFHRVNGLDAPKFLMVQAENQYSKAYRFNVSVLGEIPFNASMTATDGYGFRTCRFQYNSEWYGGFAIIISNANLSHVSFVGTNYNNTITGIDIYNRNTGAILNSEVYDSILYDYGDFKNTLYRNSATVGLEAYPVNSIYISYSHTSPAELFGGTWHRIQSRFLWGTTTEGTIGATAGEQTHVLTVSEMPSHRHSVTGRADGNGTSGAIIETYASYSNTRTAYTDYTGGGNAHNNMPPYVNVAIWRRTA